MRDERKRDGEKERERRSVGGSCTPGRDERARGRSLKRLKITFWISWIRLSHARAALVPRAPDQTGDTPGARGKMREKKDTRGLIGRNGLASLSLARSLSPRLFFASPADPLPSFRRRDFRRISLCWKLKEVRPRARARQYFPRVFRPESDAARAAA